MSSMTLYGLTPSPVCLTYPPLSGSSGHSEIEKFQGSDGKKEEEEKKYLDVISNKNIKLSERVLIPVKQYPKFNFVGKLLGPRGNSLKRLQEETGAKMSILGKGSMRDKAKEEELRKSGEAKYAHLSDELHVLIEVFAPPGEAYSRMSHALEEIKKFLVPDYNDEIRQEQLRELSYLNGSEDSGRGRGIRGRGVRTAAATPSRGRGGAVPPPLPPGRGVLTPRGATVTRGALPVPPIARGVSTPRARGASSAPGYRALPHPAPEAYEEYAYDDGCVGDYEAYDSSYATQTQSVAEYYDYGHGVSEDVYDSYVPEEWAASRSSLKAPPPRPARGGFREHPYGRY
ncbi:PREDICTED: KH domain-containing, RNA-binding, signal transduction-associated protein 2 [Dipodomys ordii]|uniref:KH domain-containing, RNA-binding, signal transduction-associated protein 2 n=1 Tax=Dipodomys ordii TaxID=10020 RepID=A0A1S3FD22_DIPOR|nr:PREDICTED: KH domain-containing, RNA-binding, signal transduction-associated protein 2 [Dipodomys ordii]